jgi:tRNA(Ile2) C34 agmatinyltransferase TiaS
VPPSDAPRIQFSCPKCGVRMKADPRRVGAKIGCPNCQTAVVVPKESEPDAPRRAGQGKKERNLAGGIVCLFLAVLGCSPRSAR